MTHEKPVRHWQSKGGRYVLKLFRHDNGYRYASGNGGGNLGDVSFNQALRVMHDKILSHLEIDGIRFSRIPEFEKGGAS